MPTFAAAATRWLPRAAVGLGLLAVALQAFDFAVTWLGPNLDSDILYPYVFARDLLDGGHPLSGWTLSSAPYLVPDFAVLALLTMLCGPGPAALIAYVVLSAVGLALLGGWSLARAGMPRERAWLAGVVIVNLLLIWRGFGEHGRHLACLLLPGFHGGAVLAGLALFGWWIGPWREAPRRAAAWLGGALMFVTAVSDTLVLTQFMGPFLIAMAIVAGRDWRAARRLHGVAIVTACVAVAVVATRLALPWLGVLNFTKVVRYTPLPSAVVGAAGTMARDLATVVAPGAVGFVALIVVALIAVALGREQSRRVAAAEREHVRIAGWFAALCLASTTLMPVFSVYWTSPYHVRLTLPWLVMPMWWAVLVWWSGGRTSHWRFPSWTIPLVTGLAFVAAGAVASTGPSRLATAWPYPERVAALDGYLREHGHTHGLGDFWHAHLFNTLSRAGLRLNQLRPDGRMYFWNNNAFHHFDVAPDAAGARGAGSLVVPHYSFIILGGLDAVAIESKFGPPAHVVDMAGETVWLYDEAGADRITGIATAEVRARLGPMLGAGRLPK